MSSGTTFMTMPGVVGEAIPVPLECREHQGVVGVVAHETIRTGPDRKRLQRLASVGWDDWRHASQLQRKSRERLRQRENNRVIVQRPHVFQ